MLNLQRMARNRAARVEADLRDAKSDKQRTEILVTGLMAATLAGLEYAENLAIEPDTREDNRDDVLHGAMLLRGAIRRERFASAVKASKRGSRA